MTGQEDLDRWELDDLRAENERLKIRVDAEEQVSLQYLRQRDEARAASEGLLKYRAQLELERRDLRSENERLKEEVKKQVLLVDRLNKNCHTLTTALQATVDALRENRTLQERFRKKMAKRPWGHNGGVLDVLARIDAALKLAAKEGVVPK